MRKVSSNLVTLFNAYGWDTRLTREQRSEINKALCASGLPTFGSAHSWAQYRDAQPTAVSLIEAFEANAGPQVKRESTGFMRAFIAHNSGRKVAGLRALTRDEFSILWAQNAAA